MRVIECLKRTISILLCLVMVFSAAPELWCMGVDAAAKTAGNVTEFSGGNGTAEDPYLISTSQHLNNVRNYLSAHFRMVNDIDFVESAFSIGGEFYNDGNGWTPIGISSKPFKGVFDGNGFNIENLKIVGANDISGLFAKNTGTIKNLNVTATISSTYDYIGGIAGENTGTIDSCVFNGEISGDFSVGGIVGGNEGCVTNCVNYGSILGSNSSIGGIAGRHSGSLANISYCTNYGSVKSTDTVNHYGYAGGIIGAGEGKIEYCASHGTVTGDTAGGIAGQLARNVASASISYCYNTGAICEVTTSSTCGGIVGNQSRASVSYCYNSGKVGVSKANKSGGITGYIAAGVSTSISNCFNTGEISGYYTGGIFGRNTNFQNTITCCYNTGNITSTNGIKGGIGGRYAGGVTKCYYLNNVSTAVDYGPTDSLYNCEARSCSLEDMKKQSTFADFNFDEIWSISDDVNNGYPYLQKVLATVKLENITMSLYSASKNLTICKGDIVEYAVQMKSGGQIIHGSMLKGSFDFTFSPSDGAIFQVSDVRYMDDGVLFSVTALQEGNAILTVTESKTQNALSAEVWVTNGIRAYNAEALPSYYDAGNEYNGYINGIYIDNFSSERQESGYSVSFDAYNMHCISGVAVVYDAQGNLHDFAIIDRFDGGNITSLGDWLITSCSLIGDLFTGNLLSYKANHLSRKTSVDFANVPYGGKIEITNNVQYSDVCALFNYVDIIVTSVGLAMDIVMDSPEKPDKALNKEVATSFVAEYALAILGDTTKGAYSGLATKAKEKLIESSTEKILIKELTDGLAGLVDEGKTLIAQTGIDLDGIIKDVAIELGLGIPESALQEAMGPFGEILKGMFTASKYSGFLSFYIDLTKKASQQALVIQFSSVDGQLNDNGVTIKSGSGEDLAKQNYVLQSQVIPNDMLDNTTQSLLALATNTHKYVVREVSLERNNEIVQPQAPVTVSIPLPDSYIADKSRVYMLEEDALVPIDSVCKDGTFSFVTNDIQSYVIAQEDELKFSGASLSLQHNLAINYKVDKALFEDVCYTDPYVVFELNGVKTTVSSYAISGDRYVFTFRNIAPNQMNDTIYATLYATYDGVEYSSATREYSVAEYCYSMLELYAADQYAELRTLLVDLLHYGAASQTYTGYRTDAMVNASLTDAQLLWGTSGDPSLDTVLDTAYETVENPTAVWKGAGLSLQDSVAMRLKFTAQSIDGLTVKVESGENTWTISSDKFLEEDGVYYVYFTGLDAGQMRQSVYLTVCDEDTPVSNTVCYSIGSYAYEKQNSTIAGLSELVKTMMKYGDSAYAYAN